MTTTSPLKEFQKIQKLQWELDGAKVEQRKWSEKVRSLSQKIPEMIRKLELQ